MSMVSNSLTYFLGEKRNMNYKKITLVLLLLPITSYCNNEARIKELEDARFRKESEIAYLSNKISEEYSPYWRYRDIALNYWNPIDEEDKEISFDKFVTELGTAFDNSKNIRSIKDIDSIIEKKPLIKEDGQDQRIIVLRVVLQYLFIERLIARYTTLVEELIIINKGLNNLKQEG